MSIRQQYNIYIYIEQSWLEYILNKQLISLLLVSWSLLQTFSTQQTVFNLSDADIPKYYSILGSGFLLILNHIYNWDAHKGGSQLRIYLIVELAMAASITFVQGFKDLFTCSVCFENFNNEGRKPKFLSCYHTLCLECIKVMYLNFTLFYLIPLL